MEQYTIYCTEEQTRKAIDLGAPIKINSHFPINGEKFMWLSPPEDAIAWNNSTNCLIPTAEQMIGWILSVDESCSFKCLINGKNREAILKSAIDEALEYLSNK